MPSRLLLSSRPGRAAATQRARPGNIAYDDEPLPAIMALPGAVRRRRLKINDDRMPADARRARALPVSKGHDADGRAPSDAYADGAADA